MDKLPASLFQPAETVVERTVALADGSSHKLWFRLLPNSVIERYGIHRAARDEEVVAMAPTWLVAQGLCDPQGLPVLSVPEADRLKREVLIRMANEILDVNGFAPPKAPKQEGAPAPNGSEPEATTGSGTPLQ